jgi:hypothetical protein
MMTKWKQLWKTRVALPAPLKEITMPTKEQEFTFPDEQGLEGEVEGKKAVQNEVELEIVDDTPLEDRNRQPLDRVVEDPTDEELQSYGEKVQARLKELTHARHDDRRRAEKAERELQEATELARRMMVDQQRLQEQFNKGRTEYVTQAQKMAELEVDRAKEALTKAHEAGDTEAFVKAQADLTAATVAAVIAKNSPQRLQQQDNRANVAASQPKQPSVVDPKAEAWWARNRWFGDDDEMTSFARGVHRKLAKAGYDLSSDEYYAALDRRLREVFPKNFQAASTNGTDDSPRSRPAANIVASASRSTGPKKIRLTQSQVDLARRLGVTPEAYAKQVQILEQTNG